MRELTRKVKSDIWQLPRPAARPKLAGQILALGRPPRKPRIFNREATKQETRRVGRGWLVSLCGRFAVPLGEAAGRAFLG